MVSCKKILASLLSLCFVFALALSMGFYNSASAVTQEEIDALKEEQSALSSDKAAIQAQLDKTQGELENTVASKVLLEEQISIIVEDLRVTNALIASYDEQIAEKEVELAEAEEEEAIYFQLFCDRVRAMEEGGDVSYWAVLFNASDFSDLLDRLTMIGEIMEYDNRIMDLLEEARIAVNDAKTVLEGLRAEQDEYRIQLEASQAELDKQNAALDILIAQIKADAEAYEDQIAAISLEQVDLSSAISSAETALAAEIEAARLAALAAASSGDNTLVGTGDFIWPLPGYYSTSSAYGWRIHPITGLDSFHGGEDIPAPANTPIIASKSGTVVIAQYNSSYGNYVVISHYDGTKTLYAHMTSDNVYVGETVSQGATIGYVGTTGSSTGNHLHFEIWLGSTSSTRVNPMDYFDF